MSGLGRTVSLGLIWSFAQTWGVRLLGMLQMLLVARILSVEDIGIITLAGVIVSGIGGLVDQGLTETIQQRSVVEREHLNSAFWAVLGVAVLLALALGLTAPAVARVADKPYLVDLLRALAITLPLNGISVVPTALLMRELHHRQLAYRALTAAFISTWVGVGLSLAGFGYWSIAIKMLVESTAYCILAWVWCPWRPQLQYSSRHFKELFGMSRIMLGVRLLSLVHSRMDSLLLGIYTTPASLGIYSTGQRAFGVLMDALFSSINQVATPAFCRIHEDTTRMQQAFLRVIRMASFVAVPIFACGVVLCTEITVLMYGEKWAASGPIFGVFCCGGLIVSVSYFSVPAYIARGRPELALYASAIALVSNAVAIWVAFPYGPLGIAVAIVARTYLFMPLNLVFLKKAVGISATSYIRAIFPAYVSAGAAAFVSWLAIYDRLVDAAILRSAAAVVVGGLTYALFSLYCFRQNTFTVIGELKALRRA